MKVFGEFNGYDSRVYGFKVPYGMVPEALIVPKLGGKDRDFIIVPERQLVDSIPSLKHLGSSKILDERYAYVAADGMVIDLQTDSAEDMSIEYPYIRFAVVRWNRKYRGRFPREIACVARSVGPDSMPVNSTREIILAAPNKK
jgi:hypothetical protein